MSLENHGKRDLSRPRPGRGQKESAGREVWQHTDNMSRRTTRAKSPDDAKLSAALVEDLTAHRTAALRAVLATRPDVALVAAAHSLALRVLL